MILESTKNRIKRYCTKVGLISPRFSGKNKVVYFTKNVSYIQEQNLKELTVRLRYKYSFSL